MNAIYTTADDVQQKNGMVGMVVQLPLPSNINTKMVLDSVPARFDIDGLSTGTLFTAPVAGAVEEIFNRKNINPAGKKVLVVGSGKLVGEPVRSLLVSLGADVVMVDNSTDITELTKLSKRAYIIVSGTGVPGLIQPNMISNECVLIDAGTSTQNGGVVGDIAYECKEKAKYFARTPGGVGPVTVAVLFKNLILGNNIIK
jgi:methylenetetrahydrofolate dehydrogenase (NADP+)/methenyltetrahydrofolate cyclohydrolase